MRLLLLFFSCVEWGRCLLEEWVSFLYGFFTLHVPVRLALLVLISVWDVGIPVAPSVGSKMAKLRVTIYFVLYLFPFT